MQFTEISFAIFFISVFALYWLVLRKSVKAQNVLLLSASYLFYGWWDWRFLGLIMLTTATTFVSALYSQSRHGKLITTSNIILNVGILAVFKYFNFFSENLAALTEAFGWQIGSFTIDLLLPVGISFYTFQAISYSVDTYKRQASPCRDFLTFATFIAYFPQLVAGPIERASSLLPQICTPRKWDSDYAVSGLRMILFGLMKKLCIADMLAIYVDRLYAGDLQNPIICVLAGILFSLEIYCDFSAYCEIARGTSRLLGIELMINFRFPFFSRNIIDFWQRWHISLMQWFRDYIYIPLGGSRCGRMRTIRNMAIVFLISGLWHGAAWNFIVWGAYWALVYIVGKSVFNIKRNDSRIRFSQLPKMVITFGFVAFGFFIFRCANTHEMMCGIQNLWAYATCFTVLWLVSILICHIFSSAKRCAFVAMIGMLLFAIVAIIIVPKTAILLMLRVWWVLPLLIAFAAEWYSRDEGYPLARLPQHRFSRYALYWVLAVLILLSEPTQMAFIYFQF